MIGFKLDNILRFRSPNERVLEKIIYYDTRRDDLENLVFKLSDMDDKNWIALLYINKDGEIIRESLTPKDILRLQDMGIKLDKDNKVLIR